MDNKQMQHYAQLQHHRCMSALASHLNLNSINTISIGEVRSGRLNDYQIYYNGSGRTLKAYIVTDFGDCQFDVLEVDTCKP